MASLNPYLNFNGNTEEAFTFYKSVFGGEFTNLMRFKDMPKSEAGVETMPDMYANNIMHVSLPIGDSILMASDCIEAFGQKAVFGSSTYISIQPEIREETARIYTALSEEGEIEMELQEMFWGDLFGSFTDQFGIKWMVGYPLHPEN